MFIAKGGGDIEDYVIIRVPFMDENEFNEKVLCEWGDNPYKDYQLHYLEKEDDDLPTLDTNGNNLDNYEPKRLPSEEKQKINPYDFL